MPDTHLCHYGNGHRLLNLGNHLGVGHARHAALLANVRGHAFERHNRARLLGNDRLLGVGNVHNDAAFEHLRKIPVEQLSIRRLVVFDCHNILLNIIRKPNVCRMSCA